MVAAAVVAATVAVTALGTSAAEPVVAGSALALEAANLILNGLKLHRNSFDFGSVQGHLHVVNARQGHIEVAQIGSAVHPLNLTLAEASGLAQKVLEREPGKALGLAHVNGKALLLRGVHAALALGSALFVAFAAFLALLLGADRGNFSLFVHVVLHELVQFGRKEAFDQFARSHVLKLRHYGLDQRLDDLGGLGMRRKLFGKMVHLARQNFVARGQLALNHLTLNHLLNEGDFAALHRIDKGPALP